MASPLTRSSLGASAPPSLTSQRTRSAHSEKDGGAFVKFSYVPSALPATKARPVDPSAPEMQQPTTASDVAVVDVERIIREHMGAAATTYKPWWILGDGKFFLVQVRGRRLVSSSQT